MKEAVESDEEDEKSKLEGATWVVKCLLSPLFHRDSTLERWIWNGFKPKAQPDHQLA